MTAALLLVFIVCVMYVDKAFIADPLDGCVTAVMPCGSQCCCFNAVIEVGH
jgi:hypothetical protein